MGFMPHALSLVTASFLECLLTLPAFLLQGFLLSCWRAVKSGKAGDNTPLNNEGQERPTFLRLRTEVSATVRPLTFEPAQESPEDLITMQILIRRAEVGQDSAFLIGPQVTLVLMVPWTKYEAGSSTWFPLQDTQGLEPELVCSVL